MLMVRPALKPSLRPASCCNVDVMNGLGHVGRRHLGGRHVRRELRVNRFRGGLGGNIFRGFGDELFEGGHEGGHGFHDTGGTTLELPAIGRETGSGHPLPRRRRIPPDLHPFARLRPPRDRISGSRQNPPMPPSGGSVSVLREIERKLAIFVA